MHAMVAILAGAMVACITPVNEAVSGSKFLHRTFFGPPDVSQLSDADQAQPVSQSALAALIEQKLKASHVGNMTHHHHHARDSPDVIISNSTTKVVASSFPKSFARKSNATHTGRADGMAMMVDKALPKMLHVPANGPGAEVSQLEDAVMQLVKEAASTKRTSAQAAAKAREKQPFPPPAAPQTEGVGDFQTVVNDMIDSLKPQIISAHAAAVTLLETEYGGFATCDNTWAATNGQANAAHGTYSSSSSAHKECRDEEEPLATQAETCAVKVAVLEQAKDALCQAVQDAIKNPEASYCTPTEGEDYVSWTHRKRLDFEAALKAFEEKEHACEDKGKELEGNHTSCENTKGQHAAKQQACNTLAFTMDEAKCNSVTLQEEACTVFTACYNRVHASYTEAEALVRTQEPDYKIEWETLELMECLLKGLADGLVGDAIMQQIETCREKEVNTTQFDINYPQIPPMKVCPEIDVYPCSDSYIALEYDPLPPHAKGACTKCPAFDAGTGYEYFRNKGQMQCGDAPISTSVVDTMEDCRAICSGNEQCQYFTVTDPPAGTHLDSPKPTCTLTKTCSSLNSAQVLSVIYRKVAWDSLYTPEQEGVYYIPPGPQELRTEGSTTCKVFELKATAAEITFLANNLLGEGSGSSKMLHSLAGSPSLSFRFYHSHAEIGSSAPPPSVSSEYNALVVMVNQAAFQTIWVSVDTATRTVAAGQGPHCGQNEVMSTNPSNVFTPVMYVVKALVATPSVEFRSLEPAPWAQFTKTTTTTTTTARICTCPNGVAHTGSNCPDNGAVSCAGCLTGFMLGSGKCVAPTWIQCARIKNARGTNIDSTGVDGNTYLSTSWGLADFTSQSAFGNHCPDVVNPIAVKFKVLDGSFSMMFETGAIPLEENVFVMQDGLHSASNDAGDVFKFEKVSGRSGRLIHGTSCQKVEGGGQRTTFCVANGENYQAILGGINGDSYGNGNGPCMCDYVTMCGYCESTQVVEIYMQQEA